MKFSKRVKVLAVALSLMYASHVYNAHKKTQTPYLRDHVVMLSSDQGLCSGFNVTAPSGKTYIMTAAHCVGLLASDKSIEATDEQGHHMRVFMVKINEFFDLMLLTNNTNNDGLKLAKSMKPYDHVFMLGHGGGMPTFREDGEYLKDQLIIHFGADGIIIRLVEVTTITAIPGCSGGPVFNDNGEIVGVVSATDGFFGYMVPLDLVQLFLADK